MSRCFDPWDCKCADVDSMENLKCGPCKKSRKRAEDMLSSNLWNYTVRQENLPTNSGLVTEFRETRSQGKAKTEGFDFFETVNSQLELKRMQRDDPDIRPVIKWYEEQRRPHGNKMTMESPETRYCWIL